MGGKNSYESTKRYQDKAYDAIPLRVRKGKKERIKAHAEACHESVNAFINRAIEEAMERDKASQPPCAGGETLL